MTAYKEELGKKMISAEEAASLVKDGDIVVIPMGREPVTLGYALAARKNELKGVRISPALAARDFGWYDPGWEDSFFIEAVYVLPIMHTLFDERKADYCVLDPLMRPYYDIEGIDVLWLTVSPPNKHGYVSFGGSVWYKRKQIQKAKIVIAEINPHQIRTYGDNAVHISEIDYFVEHEPLDTTPVSRDMTGRVIAPPGAAEKKIAEHVSSLIKDGDTIMVGIGGATEFLLQLGAFDGRQDLGIHTEIISTGLIKGMRQGIFTGERKTLHKGIAVGTAIGGGRAEYDFADENPKIELRDADYVLDPRTIAANDNMVALGSAFALDLAGQGATDSLGYTMRAGTGGQVAFAFGTTLARGGRYIIALTSTTSQGKPRIVSQFQPGTIASIPRWLTDIVVTEYGIARLRGKTQRQRALDLISIAHPDHRGELKREAEKHFWP